MRILVTGATGFVGSHVARQLVERGETVRALVRRTSRVDNLASMDVEPVVGDLNDPESLKQAVAGCDRVFHVAAEYRLWSRDPKDLYRSNVEGTLHLLCAAKAEGVEWVVYTSTVGALGIPVDGSPGKEDSPVSIDDMIGHYKRSKFLAEEAAVRFACEESLPLVIVNPSTPVGENDIKPTPTGKIVVDFLNRKMPAYVHTGLNLIDVRDVAAGHLLAADHGKPGERYILGNRNVTLHEILGLLAEITGLRAPRIRMPMAVAYGAAQIDTLIFGTILRREPHFPLEGVKMAHKHMYFDSGKAVRELGLPQSPVEEALGRAVEWFRANGYVKS